MAQNYNKILEEVRKLREKINPEQLRKTSQSGIPIYSLIEILKSFNKNTTKKEDPVSDEGWISSEKDLPPDLLEEITKTVSKGYISATEKEKIYAKARGYEIATERIDDFIALESGIALAAINKNKKKNQLFVTILGTILSLGIVSIVLFFMVFVPYKRDKNALRKYVLPYSLNLRSSQLLADGTVIKSIPYGTEVKIFQIDSSWAKVKVGKVEGYMSEPYKYLVDKELFYEIDGLFGNKEARDVLVSSFLKKALIKYFAQNNLQGVINEDIQIKLYGKILNNEIWQVFGFAKEAKFNAATSGKLLGAEANCSAVIITNLKSKEKRLLIFRFDSKDNGTLIYNELFPANCDGISVIGKNKDLQYLNDFNKKVKEKSKIVSLVAGENDLFSINPQIIYLYNGHNFRKFILTQKIINY
jgi:hypothetical protein